MNKTDFRRLQACCHCGELRVALDWPGLVASIPVRACGCGFCTKHKGAWTSHPDGRFHLRLAPGARVARYRLGTRTAEFHVRAVCGVVPVATCVIEGTRYAVVNANTFDDAKSLRFAQTVTDFEGETTEDRLARRRRNWTPEAFGEDGRPHDAPEGQPA